MLPNIELDSGATVAVELDYTPAAAEIVTPMEGNVALAVCTQPPDGADWSPVTLVDTSPTVGAWYVQKGDLDVTIANGVVTVNEPGAGNLSMWTQIDALPTPMEILFAPASGVLVQGFFSYARLQDSGAVVLSQVNTGSDGRIVGTLAHAGTHSGPYTVLLYLTWEAGNAPSFAAPLSYIPKSVTLSAAMRPGQIAGTRGAREDNTIYSGLLPDGITLFPLDPARLGLGVAGSRVGLLEFTGPGAADVRAAIVRWRDPS